MLSILRLRKEKEKAVVKERVEAPWHLPMELIKKEGGGAGSFTNYSTFTICGGGGGKRKEKESRLFFYYGEKK